MSPPTRQYKRTGKAEDVPPEVLARLKAKKLAKQKEASSSSTSSKGNTPIPSVSSSAKKHRGGSKEKGKKSKLDDADAKDEEEEEDNGPVEINEETGEPLYEVEYIIDDRVACGQQQYYIHWKGWGSEHDEWIDAENMACSELIKEYRKRKRQVVKEQQELRRMLEKEAKEMHDNVKSVRRTPRPRAREANEESDGPAASQLSLAPTRTPRRRNVIQSDSDDDDDIPLAKIVAKSKSPAPSSTAATKQAVAPQSPAPALSATSDIAHKTVAKSTSPAPAPSPASALAPNVMVKSPSPAPSDPAPPGSSHPDAYPDKPAHKEEVPMDVEPPIVKTVDDSKKVAPKVRRPPLLPSRKRKLEQMQKAAEEQRKSQEKQEKEQEKSVEPVKNKVVEKEKSKEKTPENLMERWLRKSGSKEPAEKFVEKERSADNADKTALHQAISSGNAMKKTSPSDNVERQDGALCSSSSDSASDSRTKEMPATSETKKERKLHGLDKGWTIKKIGCALVDRKRGKEYLLVHFEESQRPQVIPREHVKHKAPLRLIEFLEQEQLTRIRSK